MASAHSDIRPPGSRPRPSTSAPLIDSTTRTSSGADTLVGRTTGPFYSVVKVRSAGDGSEGTMSTSLLVGTDPKLDTSGVPAPASATAVNVVESIDNGKRNKQVLFVSKDSMTSVGNYYAQVLRAAGWTLLQEQAAPAAGDQPPNLVRMYTRQRQKLDIALGLDPENRLTVINANLVTTDAAR